MSSVAISFVAPTPVAHVLDPIFRTTLVVCSRTVRASAAQGGPERRNSRLPSLGNVVSYSARAAGVIAVATGFLMAGTHVNLSDVLVAPVHAATSGVMRLPPINRADRNRCTPTSSAIGQANAAKDTVLDLRECDLRSRDLAGYDLSGAILEKAVFDGSNFTNAQLSKSYASSASFRGSNFTNAVVDRVNFDKADLTGAVFANAVLSDSTFDGATLTDTDWSDSYVGDFAQRAICRNPTLEGENSNGSSTRESLGCR
jgi:hypothetical protein